ncbi:unnamed protein product [Oppiella nova]|uniref:Uncharacterized protein n=1 Tax=Oppiella nova TaxID=334625 RepID=A0A7R9M5C6_9ACAR|nr:unnamed protein product [Oppiella nova]CAG2171065.1 unnamed protein product [Oppiella nova]
MDEASCQTKCLIPDKLKMWDEDHCEMKYIHHNKTRFDLVVKHCLTRLLSHLNKSAADNILFLFANTFGSDNSLAIIKSELDKLRQSTQNIDIELHNDNMYCFDYDSFKYAVAQAPPYNIKLNAHEKNKQNKYWKSLHI